MITLFPLHKNSRTQLLRAQVHLSPSMALDNLFTECMVNKLGFPWAQCEHWCEETSTANALSKTTLMHLRAEELSESNAECSEQCLFN